MHTPDGHSSPRTTGDKARTTEPEARTTGARFRRTGRRLTRAALFSAVRGAAMTAGSTAMAALVWWVQSR
ncbi:hypothetical protein RCO28_10285 [Streptomyces sp. LHD-70]|uniref:hypothetical protein n=1 Tax=Streptomyces sp. LHD-70 TaxID=3072140 RepID=UPI00280C5809|nr:hypothetical protein [Streptomyces sp. LHD-70]MDQ8702875.1 hypothetical protein [Streptomyces sp. LHD-70]